MDQNKKILYLLISLIVILLLCISYLVYSNLNNSKLIAEKELLIDSLNSSLSLKTKELDQLRKLEEDMNNTLMKKQKIISSIIEQKKSFKIISEEIEGISERIGALDETASYTSCLNNLNKWKEYDMKFSEYYIVLLGYLNNISSGSIECKSNIEAFSYTINERSKLNEEYYEEKEDYCYGYHYVPWSETWAEIYIDPLSYVLDDRIENDDKITSNFYDAEISCLT